MTNNNIVGYAGIIITPHEFTFGHQIPHEGLTAHEISYTSDLTEADAGPTIPPLNVAMFGGSFDLGHARVRAMVKALLASDHRKAAANAKIVSEIYKTPCYTVITDVHGNPLEHGPRTDGIKDPDEAKRVFHERLAVIQG